MAATSYGEYDEKRPFRNRTTDRGGVLWNASVPHTYTSRQARMVDENCPPRSTITVGLCDGAPESDSGKIRNV